MSVAILRNSNDNFYTLNNLVFVKHITKLPVYCLDKKNCVVAWEMGMKY